MMLPPLILGQLKKHLVLTKDFTPLAHIKYIMYGQARHCNFPLLSFSIAMVEQA